MRPAASIAGWAVLLFSQPCPAALQGDCLIVASEAVSRLEYTAQWVRIIRVVVLTPEGFQGHAITVYQPKTLTHVYAFDNYIFKGSYDLETRSHDANDLSLAIAIKGRSFILEGHFLE